ARLALPHVGLEGGGALARRTRARDAAAERGTRGLECQLIDAAAVLIERAVDAAELLLDQRIGAGAPPELAPALVVRLLERLEGAHEVLEGLAHVGGGLRFQL